MASSVCRHKRVHQTFLHSPNKVLPLKNNIKFSNLSQDDKVEITYKLYNYLRMPVVEQAAQIAQLLQRIQELEVRLT
jgi:hypothetical protein